MAALASPQLKDWRKAVGLRRDTKLAREADALGASIERNKSNLDPVVVLNSSAVRQRTYGTLLEPHFFAASARF
jgi:hypothetical protein